MNLFHRIQESLTDGQTNIAPILLKLRLLAAKLNSEELGNWIRYESEGYPENINVPNYRKIPVSFTASFVGPRYRIQNASVPNYLVEKIAGQQWVKHNFRQSISEMEDLISKAQQGIVHIDASDLILLLQGKFYPDCTCTSVSGTFSASFLIGIQNTVRYRVLEFTIQLEKSIPLISSIKFSQAKEQNKKNIDQNKQVTQIFNNTIYGGYTSINSENNIQINLITKGDKTSLIKYFTYNKIPEDDAKALTDIVASEQPKTKENLFGTKINKWIKENLTKKSKIWKIACSTVVKILEKAISQYYGL